MVLAGDGLRQPLLPQVRAATDVPKNPRPFPSMPHRIEAYDRNDGNSVDELMVRLLR